MSGITRLPCTDAEESGAGCARRWEAANAIYERVGHT